MSDKTGGKAMDNSFGTRVGAHGTRAEPRPRQRNNYALDP